MIVKIKNALLVIAGSLALLVPVALPALAHADADIPTYLCKGTNLKVNDESECPKEDPSDKINELISNIINFLSFVVGVVSVIMIMVGGFKYITSGGDSSKVTSAKNTILYAIIGLIIVALAQVIVKFVLSRATT